MLRPPCHPPASLLYYTLAGGPHRLPETRHMVGLVREKYKHYLYLEIMPEESKNAAFYQRFGFQVMEDGVAMQICNFEDRR